MGIRVFLISILLLSMLSAAKAQVYNCSNRNQLIGSSLIYEVKEDESLIEIARMFDLGYMEIMDANPGVDPLVPGNGLMVRIPASKIPPFVPASYEGIVINLSEMRLYYFFKDDGAKRMVKTFPIGIGSEGTPTPEGNLSIIEKIENPVWHVPKSIKKEKPSLPDELPPGEDNPLGSHALRLSNSRYLIHGTNKPWGIGRRYSHGCIRLYPEDISDLFRSVSTGCRVKIVRQPVKIGVKGKDVYIEVHRDRVKQDPDYFSEALKLLGRRGLLKTVSIKKMNKAISEKRGMPAKISP